MDHRFDRDYWEAHWREGGHASVTQMPPNPHLSSETDGLAPGTALDAGCGTGAEAIWLAAQGWQVMGADVSSAALSRAEERARECGISDQRVRWLETDLSTWSPGVSFDLVVSHYAHPAMPQLDFYDRIASWVAPGGSLLIVGHLHTHDVAGAAHEHGPPLEASVSASSVVARLDASRWTVVTAEERRRVVPRGGGRDTVLHDVVVRAERHGLRPVLASPSIMEP